MRLEARLLSSNGKTVHTVTFDSGRYSCTCQSWKIKLKQQSDCKHIIEGRLNWFKTNKNLIK